MCPFIYMYMCVFLTHQRFCVLEHAIIRANLHGPSYQSTQLHVFAHMSMVRFTVIPWKCHKIYCEDYRCMHSLENINEATLHTSKHLQAVKSFWVWLYWGPIAGFPLNEMLRSYFQNWKKVNSCNVTHLRGKSKVVYAIYCEVTRVLWALRGDEWCALPLYESFKSP